MAWLADLHVLDLAPLVVGVCSLLVSVLLAMLQRHQPTPRIQRTGIATAARVGVVVSAALAAACLVLALVLAVAPDRDAAQTSTPAPRVPEAAATPTQSTAHDDLPGAGLTSALPPGETPDDGGLSDSPPADAGSRLVQVTEPTVPSGADASDQPWPSTDGLCWQLGRSSHAWLPGQITAWDGTEEGKSALIPRKILAPGAAYTWSCTRGGAALTQADFNYNCATFYGDDYVAAVVDPDNAYSWVCRPHA